jgi:DNA (cytosine-5)-methyltransferase 3A
MMKVLSLFDGISVARVALERVGFHIDKYYASEIDPYAIKIAMKNYPDTIQVGDITKLKGSDFKDIDLIIGGSPCQDLSIAKASREGLSGKRSCLFWEYARLLKEIKPRFFVLENVNSMSKESKDTITKTLGIEPIMINASLVSAQNRKRLFWTNIPNITQPEDRGILLKDILQPDAEVDERMCVNGKSFSLTASYNGAAVEWNSIERKQRTMVRIGQIGKGGQGERIYSSDGKSVNLSANGGGRGAKTGLYVTGVARAVRKLTPIECERLQSLKDNYTEGVSNTQRYKLLGNAFNCDVVAHIFKELKLDEK